MNAAVIVVNAAVIVVNISQPPIESAITTLNTASSEYRKVSSGRISPGCQLSRFERKMLHLSAQRFLSVRKSCYSVL